ncbi:hypothetical protein [Endozoicomonas sp. 8E]|uniref:hypothetical protein n=1 Tax=Endozoicomonas sp. 8E TaxID=3035692 RepID=UPI002938D133|nr:hypothetical protein [Endozoicomonas sp. 8E]WOG26946.1 hypothetical protein P6910_20710 [Endozoicomonas sp. 8E]
MSVICQARPLVKRFIVELEQNADFPDQHFSIKRDLSTLSYILSDIVEKNDYTEPVFPSHIKRHKPDSYGVKTTLIDSISWQWLYTTNLLIAYELILTTKGNSLCPTLYSWLPLEAVITVSWLLKSYWNPGSPLFNPFEQKKKIQDHPFAITTMMAGSEQTPQQAPPSESSGQPVQQAITFPKGYFTQLLYSDSADGDENPQQHSHTLGLNCFVHPCNDVCQFRQSSDSSDNGALATHGQSSCPCLTNAHCYCSTNGAPSDGFASDSIVTGAADNPPPARQTICNVIMIGDDGQLQQCGRVFKNEKSMSCHKSLNHRGQKTCVVKVFSEDGQQRPCGTVCKTAQALSDHKRKVHTGQQTCNVTVIREDGQERPCGKLCKSAQSLSLHKSRHHYGQKTCDVILVGEDGQQRPCGTVCKNVDTLRYHKNNIHIGQQTCDVMMVVEDGERQPCGKVFKNAYTLSAHKKRKHSEQKACDVIVTDEDGQERPCRKVCKSVSVLQEHKRRTHIGQQTCDVMMVGEDGERRPCEKVFKNAYTLSAHKKRKHSEQKACDVIVTDEDGQERPCRKVCKSVSLLQEHKRRTHIGQQTCDVMMVGEDGERRPCEKVCKNAYTLSAHKKRKHSEQKACDVIVTDEDGQERPMRDSLQEL